LIGSLSGTPVQIWHLLRWPIIQELARRDYGTESAPSSNPRAVRRLSASARVVLPRSTDAERAPRDASVVFHVSGRSTVKSDGRWKNWMVDDFALELGRDALVVQDRELPQRGEGSLEREVESFTLKRLHLRVELRARISGLPDRDERAIRSVAKSAFSRLGIALDSAAQARAIEKALANARRASPLAREYRRWLAARSSTRLLLMESASYGGSRAVLAHAARDLGIDVAELQHGWIGRVHGAYNMGRIMFQEPLRSSLPDTLFTYGEYWGRELRTPSSIHVVGKPHLNRVAASALPIRHRSPAVLFVSSMYRRDELARLALHARSALPEAWRVLVRLHPSERNSDLSDFPGLTGASGIDIDPELDVYESLSRACVVLGHSSTVLYEALAFGCRVIPIDSPLLDDYARNPSFGNPVHDGRGVARELTALVGAGLHDNVDESHELTWSSASPSEFLDAIRFTAARSRKNPPGP